MNTQEKSFTQNVELDAQMILVSNKREVDWLLNFALSHREEFDSTERLQARFEWLRTKRKITYQK